MLFLANLQFTSYYSFPKPLLKLLTRQHQRPCARRAMRQRDTHLVKFFRVTELVLLADAEASKAVKASGAASSADVGAGFGGVVFHTKAPSRVQNWVQSIKKAL